MLLCCFAALLLCCFATLLLCCFAALLFCCFVALLLCQLSEGEVEEGQEREQVAVADVQRAEERGRDVDEREEGGHEAGAEVEGASLREFVQQRDQGQDQGRERGFEQEGHGEVVPPAVGAVFAQQVGLMAAAAVAQHAQDGDRVGGGGHGEGDARRRADLKAVDGPEGRAGKS